MRSVVENLETVDWSFKFLPDQACLQVEWQAFQTPSLACSKSKYAPLSLQCPPVHNCSSDY